VLSYEKMENGLKLLFRVVSECLDIYIYIYYIVIEQYISFYVG
jgi:hypothetical protein